jgi:polyvinyl alcohol dehydrogenase (cytochrome)
LFVLAGLLVTGAQGAGSASWSMSGQGITNWRYQSNETQINATNAGSLKPAWAATLGGDISATPAVVDGVAYVPDWGGHLSAVDTQTGAVIWQKDVAALAGAVGRLKVDIPSQTVVVDTDHPGVVSRTSPAVSGNTVVIGTQTMRSTSGVDGARLVAVDKTTGNTLWVTRLDQHPLSIDSMSPTIYNGKIYVGVASIEENGIDCNGPNDDAHVCYFRGSVKQVDLATGHVDWTTYTITSEQVAAGYSGAAVWGSSPAIDVKRGSVYITTGNNYSASVATSACVDAATTPEQIFACETVNGVGNYVDAIMSLDLSTGAIKWVHKLEGFDAWTTACIGLPTACPAPNGPDYDFGQGAMLIPTKTHGDIVAAGQKAGIMWALNADTGATVWKTTAGPGSSLGGMEWGSATDGKRIYFAIANFNFFNPDPTFGHYAMTNPPKGTPATSDAGSWGAIDVETGNIVWQTADPNGSIDLGAVSVSNGVMYGASMGSLFFPANVPTMFAFDAANGKQLWSFTSGGSVNAGAAIANGTVYWGSGYTNLGFGGGNNKLFAFSRNGK